MTDKVGHWLQGGALVAAMVGLYFASRPRTVGSVEQQSPDTLMGPGLIQFGTPAATQLSPSNFVLGGDPIYTTYNYPPASPNPISATAQQGSNQQYYSNRRNSPSGGCGGGCGCSGCQEQFSSVAALGANNIDFLTTQSGNAMSLPYKGPSSY